MEPCGEYTKFGPPQPKMTPLQKAERELKLAQEELAAERAKKDTRPVVETSVIAAPEARKPQPKVKGKK